MNLDPEIRLLASVLKRHMYPEAVLLMSGSGDHCVMQRYEACSDLFGDSYVRLWMSGREAIGGSWLHPEDPSQTYQPPSHLALDRSPRWGSPREPPLQHSRQGDRSPICPIRAPAQIILWRPAVGMGQRHDQAD